MNLHEAARVGDEQAVRHLLAAGTAADKFVFGSLPIHEAAWYGHLGVAQLLAKAAPATATAPDSTGRTPLLCAAWRGHTEVARLLVEAAPATLSVANASGFTPLSGAAYRCDAAVVQLLAEAVPATVLTVDNSGRIPLDIALVKGAEGLPAARCLVRAASTVQPTLHSLVRKGQSTATLYVDLVSRLPLTQQEWQSIPAPFPDLAPALPAVMERSGTEAWWLVGRLDKAAQRAWLRDMALCLPEVLGGHYIPKELREHILLLCLVDE